MQSNKHIDYEQKSQAVTEYLQRQTSQAKIAAKYGVKLSSFQTWLRKYDSEGADGLKKSNKYNKYPVELKYAAVSEYLSESVSQQEICKKYKISSKTQLQRWILWYNGHKELKSAGLGRSRLMTKGRKVTFDEKVEIARYCIAHGRDYQSTIRKYNISYQQIYSWLRKYDNGGIDALVDRRGKAKPENELTDMDRLRIENKMLEAKKQRIRNGDTAIKKIEGDRKETTLSEIRLETKYTAIKELHNEYLYPINKLCKKLQISRSGYYKWLNRKPGKRQIINEDLSDKVMRMYKKHNGTLGSHRMRIFINREYGVNYNHKHIRRIMKILGISSVIRRVRHSCTVSSPKEQAAENILNRDFKADTYNQKWLTDVTEFKYGNGNKAYLSAILDLGDNRIIAWVLGHSSNNELVFKMFHAAIEDNLNAHPPFHSDIGVQYTSPALYIYLVL